MVTKNAENMKGKDEHKLIVKKLVDLGLSYNEAKLALGVTIEERIKADHIGYERGFNNGYEECRKHEGKN